jgi:hypothetical protein
MTIDRIEKELTKIHDQLAALQEKSKDLEEQKQMAEDAEAMKIIKKQRISSEKLQLLNKLSEDEIFRLLAEREKEIKNHENKIEI